MDVTMAGQRPYSGGPTIGASSLAAATMSTNSFSRR